MPSTPEGVVKERIKRLFKKLGVWYCMPIGQAYGRAGIPDFVCCVEGKFLAVEAKAGRRGPTALQFMEIDKILAAGGKALVVRTSNLDELEALIVEMKG